MFVKLLIGVAFPIVEIALVISITIGSAKCEILVEIIKHSLHTRIGLALISCHD